MANLNRRAALIGAVVSTVAIATPATRVIADADGNPHRKVSRLTKELSQALAELAVHDPTCDYVSIVYPRGTAEYSRSLCERDIWESTRRRETLRSRAIHEWRQCVEVRDEAFREWAAGKGSRSEWEALDISVRDAAAAMHDVLLKYI